MFPFITFLASMLNLGIIAFGIYFCVTLLKEIKTKNEILIKICEELKKDNKKYSVID